jgi:amino acid transporter
MILSLVICTILYIALALGFNRMISYEKLNVGDPLAFVFGAEGANIPWVAGIIAVSAVIALATGFSGFPNRAAAPLDGDEPRRTSAEGFSLDSSAIRHAWFATIITGLVVAIPALFMNLTEVTDLASIGTLFAFVVVCAGLLFKDKEFGREKRFVPYINSQFILPALLFIVGAAVFYFNPTVLSDFLTLVPQEDETMLGAFSHKIPLIVFFVLTAVMLVLSFTKKLTLIPVLGLLACSYLMTELGITNWIRFGAWLLVGLVIYAVYGYRHSKLHRREEAAEV